MTTAMTFVTKVTIDEIYEFIKDFHGRYGTTPGAGFMAGVMKVTPKTIHMKLDILEAQGKIRQIKKVRNKVDYKLV